VAVQSATRLICTMGTMHNNERKVFPVVKCYHSELLKLYHRFSFTFSPTCLLNGQNGHTIPGGRAGGG